MGQRALGAGDEAKLFAFLEPYLDSSLFFFSNVEKAGLEYRGEAFQGTYVASFDAGGGMTAVASHLWNGNMMLQGDAGLEAAARRASELSGRAVQGLIGPWDLVCRARRALGLEETPSRTDGREHLMSLSLHDLQRPALLSRSDVALRPPTEEEALGVVAAWRADYHVEALGAPSAALVAELSREEVRRWRASGTLWVLTVAGEPVAMTGFNAETRGAVQIGGVFTPTSHRGRGYARSAVAASLELARAERDAVRSVLFTAHTNTAAQRAYASLGYRVVGDFGLMLF